MTSMTSPRKMRGIVAVRAEASGDINSLIEDVNRGFNEFKDSINDQMKAKADVVVDEKIDRINADLDKMMSAIDTLNAKAALAVTPAGGEPETPEMADYKSKFNSWVRTGEGEVDIRAANRSGVMASMSVGSDPDGGYTAPVEWDRQITDQLQIISQMRQYATTQTVRGQGFRHLYNLHGAASGWVAETPVRTETGTSQFGTYEFSFGEVYANPALTQQVLDDSEIDIAAWHASEVQAEFATQEGTAFVNGNGTNRPKGVMMYDAAAESALPANQQHPLGPVLEVNSGSAGNLTPDGLIDMIYGIPSKRVTPGSAFYANRATHAVIRKMKDGQDNYLWQPPFQAGEPAQVLGYAARELSGMPDVAANAVPVIFGDMAMAYRIFDRVGVRVLRDPYTNKPYVMFYTTKRVGGGLWNPEYIRYHRVAA